MRYSAERKEAVLKKMLPPQNRNIREIAREEGILEAGKFATVVQTVALNEADPPAVHRHDVLPLGRRAAMAATVLRQNQLL